MKTDVSAIDPQPPKYRSIDAISEVLMYWYCRYLVLANGCWKADVGHALRMDSY
jgi:hypothetical protein